MQNAVDGQTMLETADGALNQTALIIHRMRELVLKGDDVREVFEAIFPQDLIERWAEELGVVVRERKRDLVALIRSLTIAAGTPNGGLQADALRSYLETGAAPVVRAAFYSWFDDPMERLMELLSLRAMAYAQEQEVDLPGILARVIDWRIIDASTVKVSNELIEQFPGAGDYAAIKVHKTLSASSSASRTTGSPGSRASAEER